MTSLLSLVFFVSLWCHSTLTIYLLKILLIFLQVRKITKRTGAYDYSHQMCLDLVRKAKRFIPKITQDKSLQETLSNLADFMIEREK